MTLLDAINVEKNTLTGIVFDVRPASPSTFVKRAKKAKNTTITIFFTNLMEVRYETKFVLIQTKKIDGIFRKTTKNIFLIFFQSNCIEHYIQTSIKNNTPEVTLENSELQLGRS